MEWVTVLFVLLLAVWLAVLVVTMSLGTIMAMIIVMVGAAGFSLSLLVMSWLAIGPETVAVAWRKFPHMIARELLSPRRRRRAG